MTLEDLDKLIRNFENQDIEFRTELGARDDKDRDVKTIVAFFNTRGGKIIFGVQEIGDTRKVVGLDISPQTLESNFVSKMSAKCEPPLNPFPLFEFLEIGGHNVVVVHCERGSQPPYKAVGEVYIRKGSNNIIATKDEIAELYRSNAPDSDRKPVRGATIIDLDLDQARTVLSKRDRVQVIEGDLETLLCRIGALVEDPNGELTPTVAGLLLFGKKPQDFLPNAKVRAEAKADPDSTEWDDIAEFTGNVFDQIKAFEAFVRRNVKVSARIVGFERVETPDVPLEALREAFVNAITHRDYTDLGAEVQIRIHGKNVSIESPGSLIAPLTVEKIISHKFLPKTRNPVIADMLVQLGYMDKRGTGFSRMVHSCEELGLSAPSFEELPNGFRASFNGSWQEAKKTKFVIPESVLKKVNLNDEHRRILKLVNENESISTAEAVQALHRSKPHTLEKLSELCDWDILEPTEKQKNHPKNRYVPNKILSTPQKKLSTPQSSSDQGTLNF